MAELRRSLFKASCLLSVSLVVLLLWLSFTTPSMADNEQNKREIPVGVILDLNSTLGIMLNSSLAFGLEDYYSHHNATATKIHLIVKSVSQDDVVNAAKEARDLIYNKSVKAIVGPENSEHARYVVELGTKSHVPVIWFSPSGPSLLPPRFPFSLISKTRSLCFQFKAIAAIIEAYGWECVIPIYEMPEFGNDLIPCLTYALQDIDTRVPYISAIQQNFTVIDKELNEINRTRTCVYLAHMSVELWSTLVEQAHVKGMMDIGYAWILTQGLSPVLNSKARDIKERGYMNGALGVRPSLDVSNTSKLVFLAKTLSKSVKNMSIYGLWAYETITALAYAAEKNEIGPKLEPSQIVIYNIVKDQEESIIGCWSPETGLQNCSEPGRKYKLRDPIWPGNTTERPPKLKIGVPKALFTDFVNVSGEGKNISATGFAVEVFKKVVEALPFPLPYEFVPVDNTNGYDDLLRGFSNKSIDGDVDVIIGDITTTGNRTDWVDFTMPYLDSSVSMVVKVRSDSRSVWILFKPFDWPLWLILGGLFVGATVIIILLEKRKENKQPTTSEEANSNEKTEDDVGGSKFKDFVRNPFLIYKSDVDRLQSGTSKWVVIVVTFLVGLVVQVYTANLTSILTEMTTAKPSPWRDMQEIKRNNGIVGYQKNSWVKNLLIYQMGFEENRIKPLENLTAYEEALTEGPKKERVHAIVDETPYLNLLLHNCSSCKMTGPIYKTAGFAFAFPINSILVSRFSAAIVEVTQDVKTFHDMKKNISLPVTIDKSEYKSDVETRRLTQSDFGGLFPMALFVLVLFFSISILKIPSITFWFTNRDSYIAHWLHKKLVSACTL